ncbi:MAG: DAK2 domain-containing protein, partial [Clostridium sp.]|nr:DAK2 domain-containing protein [Clostridium sp.]
RDISDKDVRVIETKSIPQAVTALTAFNSYADIDENIEAMTESLAEVKSGAITYAVRDTEIDDRAISQGDFLGLLEGEIKEVGKELYPLLNVLIAGMVDDESSSVTIFYGEDVDEEEFEEHIAKLEDEYPDVDIMSLPGLQPLYYFIIAVE